MDKVFNALKSYRDSASDHQGNMARSIRAAAVEALEEFQLEWLFKPNPMHLKSISEIVAHWLAMHGGMDNGYFTQVNGVVTTDTIGHLDLTLPGSDDRTGRQNRDMGHALYRLVHAYMEEHSFGPGDEIIFASKPIDHGCYSLSVSYIVSSEFRPHLSVAKGEAA